MLLPFYFFYFKFFRPPIRQIFNHTSIPTKTKMSHPHPHASRDYTSPTFFPKHVSQNFPTFLSPSPTSFPGSFIQVPVPAARDNGKDYVTAPRAKFGIPERV